MNKEMLDLYSDYLLWNFRLATATGLSDMVDGAVSHDKVTRFLSNDTFTSKELWKEVKSTVRQIENDDGVLLFDDTIEEKPHTDENEIVAWHYDHSKNDNVKGINILSALVRYGDVCLPVGFEIIKKDVYFCEIATRKEKRKSSCTKNEIFRDMLLKCKNNRLKYKYVLADSWYGCKENMDYIKEENKKDFIFAIKSNRTAALSHHDKLQGKFQAVSSMELEQKKSVEVYLKGIDFPVLLVKQVFTNQDGSIGILYLVTSDLSLDGAKITDIYQKRWRIEEYHKSIKSNAGLAKSPTKTVKTQTNHIFASIYTFYKLECLSIKTALNHFALKYKLFVKASKVAFEELIAWKQKYQIGATAA